MNRKELNDLKVVIQASRNADHKAVDAKWDRKLAAVDVLLEDEDEPTAHVSRVAHTNGSRTVAVTKTKMQAVREAISQSPHSFTSTKLFDYIRAKYPGIASQPADLSNSIWVLKGLKEIEVIKESNGTSPGEYKTTEKFKAL